MYEEALETDYQNQACLPRESYVPTGSCNGSVNWSALFDTTERADLQPCAT